MHPPTHNSSDDFHEEWDRQLLLDEAFKNL
jgi:hypothetical protein